MAIKMENPLNPAADKASRKSALMLAKMLVFAMSDFDDLGMPDWSQKLHQGVKEIMSKYELRPEDLRVLEHETMQ
jgi:hypothetical protein